MSSSPPLACPQTVVEEVKNAVHCYTGSRRVSGRLLCAESRKCVEVFAVEERTAKLLSMLSGIEGLEIFVAGIHVARMCTGKLRLLLGFTTLLDLPVTNHYVVVNEAGEKLFTYGRDVLPESVVEEKIDKKCRDTLPVLVLTQRKEPLGFAKPRSERGRVIFQNVLDVGWYLRSGV